MNFGRMSPMGPTLHEGRPFLCLCFRVANDHQPNLGHVFHREPDSLASQTAILHPSVRHVVDSPGGDVSDDYAAYLEPLPGAVRPVEIARENSRLKPVPAAIDRRK